MARMVEGNVLYPEKEVADQLCCTVQGLRKQRSEDRPPGNLAFKVGGRWVYLAGDVAAYLEAQRAGLHV